MPDSTWLGLDLSQSYESIKAAVQRLYGMDIAAAYLDFAQAINKDVDGLTDQEKQRAIIDSLLGNRTGGAHEQVEK